MMAQQPNQGQQGQQGAQTAQKCDEALKTALLDAHEAAIDACCATCHACCEAGLHDHCTSGSGQQAGGAQNPQQAQQQLQQRAQACGVDWNWLQQLAPLVADFILRVIENLRTQQGGQKAQPGK